MSSPRFPAAALCCGVALLMPLTGLRGSVHVSFHPRDDEGIRLEGVLTLPEGPTPLPAVVLCHPDPRYGGTMDSYVILAIDDALQRAGFATLRFNLRGVGASTGSFDGGIGEVRDCLGALDFLRGQEDIDGARVGLIGYSFGAWVGLQACVVDGAVPVCGCLSFPVPQGENLAGHLYFADVDFPCLLLTGTEDTISDLPTVRRLVATYRAGRYCRVEPLGGADHFFRSAEHLQAAAERMARLMVEKLGPIGGASDSSP